MNAITRPLLIVLLAAASAQATAAVRFAERSELKSMQRESCTPPRCRLALRADSDFIEVGKDSVRRSDAGTVVYELAAGPGSVIEHATLSDQGGLLFYTVAKRQVTSTANVAAAMDRTRHGSGMGPGRTGAMFGRGDVHRNYKVIALNSRSGVVAKEFDLGQVRPLAIASSAYGETLLVLGFDGGLRKNQVLAMNARNGEVFHREDIARPGDVTLGSNGYAVGGQARILTEERPSGESRFASRDQFSMAEFIVACESTLKVPDYQNQAFAFLRFENAETTLDDSMSAAAAIGLAAKGLQLVERRRMDEILREVQFQSLGLTADTVVADIGRLGNARYLVIGNMETIGVDANVGLRAIDAQSGNVASGCTMRCRDCRPQDYAEGVGYLVDAWVQ